MAVLPLLACREAGAAAFDSSPAGSVPAAREFLVRAGTVVVGERFRVVSERPGEDAHAIALARGLRRAARVGAGLAASGTPLRFVALRAGLPRAVPSGCVPEQSYELAVLGDSIVVTGSTAAARLYGVQTLVERARDSAGRLPAGDILDGPALELRGLSLDVSRGRMPTRAEFAAILDVCARFKLNQVQLYFEDTFVYSGVPRDALQPWALAPEDLREIAAEARLRHVQLVPIVQTLAHQERLLSHASTAQYSSRGAPPRGPSSLLRRIVSAWQEALARMGAGRNEAPSGTATFDVSTPEVQRLLAGMVDDVLVASGSSAIHIGCDESSGPVAGGSADAASRTGEAREFLGHVRRMADHARKAHGAETWLYDDFLLAHPELLPCLPADVVLVDWHYDPADRFPSLASLRGVPPSRIVTSPGLWNWYAIYPDYGRALPNIRAAVLAAVGQGCRGSMLASWGDGGSEDLFGNDVFGIAYFADAAWTGAPDRPLEFADRYCRSRFGRQAPAARAALRTLLELRIPNVGHNQGLVYHPVLVRERSAGWLAAVQALDGRLQRAREHLEGVGSTDAYGTAEVRALACSLDRFRAATRRELTLHQLATEIEWAADGGGTAAARADAVRDVLRLETRAAAAYEAEWRAHNVASGLPEILARLKRQAATLDSLAFAAEAGQLEIPARYRRRR